MLTRRVAIAIIAPGLLGLAAFVSLRHTQQAFPHLAHEGLFPLCESCHAGIATGVVETSYPQPADCARCHDGTRVIRVQWSAPTRRVSNLRFSHPAHFELTRQSGDSISCQSCHLAGEPRTRMNIGAPQPMLCVQCHAHTAETHPSPEVVCNTCHVPLASAPVPLERIAAFPRPAWHDSSNFLSTHGSNEQPRAASCAICHARETCERCHANADRNPMILSLPHDVRVAQLERDREPDYPTPATHADAQWRLAHGAAAQSNSLSCANCHTQPSCTKCHISSEGKSRAVIASLPALTPDAAPGVSLEQISADVHPPDIARRHGTLAATGRLACAECHTSQTCTSCHAASDSRRFHVSNFVERHAFDVFASSADCQSCHSTEAFCRDCHISSGVAAQSRMNAAFHTGVPNWVLSHGQAARRGIESCASCHRQSDCVRCHSAVGGWRVNPHGPSFPASRTAVRNAASCRWCHVGGGADGR